MLHFSEQTQTGTCCCPVMLDVSQECPIKGGKKYMKEFNQHPKKQSLVIKLCGVHMGGGGEGSVLKNVKQKRYYFF